MQIGIIGGGQLAMMLVQAAHKRDISCTIIDPNPNCSAVRVADHFICANYNDLNALKELENQVDVITYEFENIDIASLNKLSKVVQTTKPLEISTSRYLEKQAAQKAGLSPTKFSQVKSRIDIDEFILEYNYPCVVKTDRLGYDGHGQIAIRDVDDLKKVDQLLDVDCIIEKMVDIKYEFSIIAFRNKKGKITYLPSSINSHKENILHTSFYEPTHKPSIDIYKQVEEYLVYHNLIGIITLEFFVDSNDQIIFNEMAPRPHNSGHFSIEACKLSQYDLHLKAILNESFGDNVGTKALMVNVLGQDYLKATAFMKTVTSEKIFFHDYFKDEKRNNRKVGHITAVGDEAINRLKNNYLRGE